MATERYFTHKSSFILSHKSLESIAGSIEFTEGRSWVICMCSSEYPECGEFVYLRTMVGTGCVPLVNKQVYKNQKPPIGLQRPKIRFNPEFVFGAILTLTVE